MRNSPFCRPSRIYLSHVVEHGGANRQWEVRGMFLYLQAHSLKIPIGLSFGSRLQWHKLVTLNKRCEISDSIIRDFSAGTFKNRWHFVHTASGNVQGVDEDFATVG